jgi:UDP-2-acetamido-3-amino-2,3-dideoxy-glucuronate N-acetyltransferase
MTDPATRGPGIDTTAFVHPTAVVDEPCVIGAGTKIWHFCHVSAGARIGRECVLGQNVFVAATAVIGHGVKIQNNVSVYDGVVVQDDVFLGPSCVLTNVRNPRAAISRKHCFETTILGRGCTIGANATILCGVTVGQYAFVAAGAVVTKDLADYALAIGVPAQQRGWVSRRGCRLPEPDGAGIMVCPESAERYRRGPGGLVAVGS